MIPLYQVNNKIFITGSTGYIGSRLVSKLMDRDFEVYALARKGSENKLPSGCNVIIGNALDRTSYIDKISPCETFIHLVGVNNPAPSKKQAFEEIDLVSIDEAVHAVKNTTIKHFIYVSVAHPAPIMKDYIRVRLRGESLIRENGLYATILKPWYILGPGHKWPYMLLPFLKVLEYVPYTRDAAMRLCLVNINSILNALVFAVQNPANGIRYMRAPQIRKF